MKAYRWYMGTSQHWQVSRRILLYGNSVILGAIGASLRRLSQFEVTTLAPPLPDVRKLDAVNPDIVLFDLETPHTEAVFSMLETNPTLLLIGVSPDINLVKIWSGRQLKDISTQGFLDLIKGEIKDLSIDARSGENRPYRSVENKYGQDTRPGKQTLPGNGETKHRIGFKKNSGGEHGKTFHITKRVF